jgi:predicted CoA-binding protein
VTEDDGVEQARPDHGHDPSDELLTEVLASTRTIAMVGASPNWNRPSYFAMRYLQRKGFRVIPVNPRAAEESILGEPVHPTLASIQVPIDVVDVFCRSESVLSLVDEAIATGARVLWLQLGVVNDEAAAAAVAAGLTVVQDRCMKIEYGRLSGELSWSGINGGCAGGYEAGVRTVESCNLWSHLANVGDTRSLIIHPASTTHRQLSDEQRAAAGAGPEVIRLSVGIETVADLITDLDDALGVR